MSAASETDADAEGARAGVPVPDDLDRLFRLTDLVTPWAIRTIAKLRLADELAGGPRDVDQLARVMGLQRRALHRVLRFLAGAGLFEEAAPGVFALTSMGRLLVSDTDVWASLVGPCGERMASVPPRLLHSLQTGDSAFEAVFGETVSQLCARDDDANRAFNDGMGHHAASVAPRISAAYDWGSVGHVVDVGGGTGQLVACLLRDHRRLEATLVDLAPVVAQAPPVLAAAGVGERCRVVSGDFFSSVPTGGDCYLLSHVVHDWQDERAGALLQNCRDAMQPGNRLVLAETVLPDSDAPHPGRYRDIRILLMFGGIERTRDEFDALLASAGFELARVIDTGSPISLIEGFPTP